MSYSALGQRLSNQYQLIPRTFFSIDSMSNIRTYASVTGGGSKQQSTPHIVNERQTEQKRSHNDNDNDNDSSSSVNQNKSPDHNGTPPQSHRQHHNSSTDRTSSPYRQERGRNISSSHPSRQTGPYTAAEYKRPAEHTPNVHKSSSPSSDTEHLYILTLLLSSNLHDQTTSLRKRYFPAHLNKLDAHITLFHALPHSHLKTITSDLDQLCSTQRTFPVIAETPFSPKLRNVMIPASSPRHAIEGVHKSLRGRWGEWLSEQDRGGMRPHWTVMNKVGDEAEVKRALEEIVKGWKGVEGTCDGLVLWRYERGWWKDPREFVFNGGKGR